MGAGGLRPAAGQAEFAIGRRVMPSASRDAELAHWLARFIDRRVVVLGDVMLDRYVRGEVRRISPEAPIPVMRRSGSTAMLGGAANVARNAASLGARTVLVGAVGDDPAGRELAAQAAATPGLETRLISAAGWSTTVKTRFVSHGQQLLRLDEEAEPDSLRAGAEIVAATEAALESADILVLSDYAKGVLSDDVLPAVISAAGRRGVTVVADPKRADFSAYRGVDVLTPNQAEAARASGIAGSDDASVAAAGRHALERAEARAVLVTRSEHGVTLVRRNAEPLHLPTHAQAVADVSGAGDTLVAAFALALASGADLPEAAHLANLAAGIVVGKAGTATVDHAELAAALRRERLEVLDEKIADWPQARLRVQAWRAAGLRVGFTNGCFDLIHPGHVRLLAAARAACDRLVVALNTDASVRRLKGPSRPVQDEAARATVMAGMASADLVALFDEDTPEALITALLPDVLFKGSDYTLDQVVGADIVRAYGGEVRLIPLEPGHSTTGTIGRIGSGVLRR
jgi:D-beta-D-heptose 7-phosphate kinase/D-beta-D-heptose 1-phosphate adenosyltransferase